MAKRRIAVSIILFTLALASLTYGPDRNVMAQDNSGGEPGVFHSQSLDMSVTAGFGKLTVSNWTGCWVPFRITLVNQGPPISGRLMVYSESPRTPTSQGRQFIKEVTLPTGSRQLHEIAAYLNSGESPIVRLMQGQDTVAELTIAVDRSYGMSDQLEIAVLDSDSTALNVINSAEIVRTPNREPFTMVNRASTGAGQQTGGQAAGPAGSQGNPGPGTGAGAPPTPPNQPGRQRPGAPAYQPRMSAHPVTISADDLPREFVSFDPVDVVVLGDAPLSQLTEEQARALKLWIASGGLLVVTGAVDGAGLRSTGLDAMLPVEAEGSAASEPSSQLTDLYGGFGGNAPLPLLLAQLRQGARVLVGTDSKPIVAERFYGSGLVRFVAFNPKLSVYRAWVGAKDFWTDVLMPAADTKTRHSNWMGGRGPSSGIQSFLYRLARIAPPSTRYFLLFLALYVLLVGPLNYLVLRWMRKTDLAWLTIPAVVILFTLVSVSIAQISRGGDSIESEASIVEVFQRDNLARSTGGLMIMPSSKGTQEMSVAGPSCYVNDLSNSRGPGSLFTGDIETERNAKGLLLRCPMTTWTSAEFQVRAVEESASPVITVTEHPGGGPAAPGANSAAASTIDIQNLTGAPIARVVYLSSDGISDVIDLGAREEKRVSLNSLAPYTTAFTTWYSSQLQAGSEEEGLFSSMAGILDREIGGDAAFTQGFFQSTQLALAGRKLQRPLLIGFIDQSRSRMEFHGSSKQHSKSLYVIQL